MMGKGYKGRGVSTRRKFRREGPILRQGSHLGQCHREENRRAEEAQGLVNCGLSMASEVSRKVMEDRPCTTKMRGMSRCVGSEGSHCK